MSSRGSEDNVLPRISDFYPRLFERSWIIFLFSEIGVVTAVVIIFWFITKILSIDVALMLITFFLIFLQSTVGYLLLVYALKPTKLIAQTLAQVNNESSVLIPPNRNDPSLERSGLSPIINAIYSNNNQPRTEESSKSGGDMPSKILASLPIGLIALDSNRKIVFSNSLAPVSSSVKGDSSVQLDFSSIADSLDSWLEMVTTNQISAHKVWTRVANTTPGNTTDRKIFDVIVYYEKNSLNGIETIITTIDRTEEYSEEEVNLDFIALAAHELRGPITVIRGYLDILDEQISGQLTTEQQSLIERLDVSAKRLSSYVNNILNASRYDRKHLQLTLRESSIDNIVNDIKDDMELRAKTLNRQLVWQLPHNMPTVAVDQSSVSEVLSNLIDNAIKYSHDGGSIEVTARPDERFVYISIRDHGIGIPSNVASSLFNKFYRSHRSREVISGTGLGLYISRAIIESHGGSIEVESKEGLGSTFTFSLPIFATIANQLSGSNNNTNLIRQGNSWIRNHSRVKE